MAEEGAPHGAGSGGIPGFFVDDDDGSAVDVSQEDAELTHKVELVKKKLVGIVSRDLMAWQLKSAEQTAAGTLAKVQQHVRENRLPPSVAASAAAFKAGGAFAGLSNGLVTVLMPENDYAGFKEATNDLFVSVGTQLTRATAAHQVVLKANVNLGTRVLDLATAATPAGNESMIQIEIDVGISRYDAKFEGEQCIAWDLAPGTIAERYTAFRQLDGNDAWAPVTIGFHTPRGASGLSDTVLKMATGDAKGASKAVPKKIEFLEKIEIVVEGPRTSFQSASAAGTCAIRDHVGAIRVDDKPRILPSCSFKASLVTVVCTIEARDAVEKSIADFCAVAGGFSFTGIAGKFKYFARRAQPRTRDIGWRVCGARDVTYGGMARAAYVA